MWMERGVRNRLKKSGYRPPFSTITLSNVRSIQNDLSTLIMHDSDYQPAYYALPKPGWQNKPHMLHLMATTLYTLTEIRLRPIKSIGGGLCMTVNNKWAPNFCIREHISTRSYEILTVSFRPDYLPRELGQLTGLTWVHSWPGLYRSSRACRRVLQQNDQ